MTTELTTELPDLTDRQGVVRAFAANYAFRAAERDELSTPGNPFRRPVRPDDLEWLDYSGPMAPEDSLKLSAVLGGRMLRNVYDTRLTLVADAANAAVRADAEAYLDPHALLLAALAGPILEDHVFAPVRALDVPEAPTLADFARLLTTYRERRLAEPDAGLAAAAAVDGRREAATFALLQLSGYLPSVRAALGLAAVASPSGPAARLAARISALSATLAPAEHAILESLAASGLSTTTAAYWQMYLGTTLNRGNIVHALVNDRRSPYAVLGAALAAALDAEALAPRAAEAFADGLGIDTNFAIPEVSPAIDAALAEVAAASAEFGADVIAQVWRGFVQSTALEELWNEDLATQLRWADAIDEHKAKADRIAAYLEDNQIEVDLDTFVESCEETSTTHVHNEHRLVMIEAGQMHFWNNVTHQIGLNTGDKVLIPVSRLHGSTVLSGECTYHQPILDDAMLARALS